MKVGMVTGAAELGYGAYIFNQAPTGTLSLNHAIVIGRITFEAAEKALHEYVAANPEITIRNLRKNQKVSDRKPFAKKKQRKKQGDSWRVSL